MPSNENSSDIASSRMIINMTNKKRTAKNLEILTCAPNCIKIVTTLIFLVLYIIYYKKNFKNYFTE